MRNVDEGASISVAGRAIWQGGGRRPRTFPEGRVCVAPGCATVLSIYNRRDACVEHEVASPRPPRFGRPLSADQEQGRRFVSLADLEAKGA